MTDLTDYEEMLKRTRAQLPAEVFKRERFEVPRLQSEIVGNRTVVRNFAEAVETLRREKDHAMKWLAKELGSAGSLEGKMAIFQGKFTGQVLDSKFQKYVETYVICQECGKPDTRLIKDDRLTFLKCEACGARRSVPRIK